MSGTPLWIRRRKSGQDVRATLLDGMQPQDLVVVENDWGTERSLIVQELLEKQVDRFLWPESIHWNWRLKAPLLKMLEATGFGIVYEQKWQAVMMTKTVSYSARLPEQLGQPMVYIDYLEVAPWNWVVPELGREGRFGYLGTRLFSRAVHQSVEEGFRGRVGLHALPQAESFYLQQCQMTPLGRDRSKEGLLYLELSPAAVNRILAKEETP